MLQRSVGGPLRRDVCGAILLGFQAAGLHSAARLQLWKRQKKAKPHVVVMRIMGERTYRCPTRRTHTHTHTHVEPRGQTSDYRHAACLSYVHQFVPNYHGSDVSPAAPHPSRPFWGWSRRRCNGMLGTRVNLSLGSFEMPLLPTFPAD